MATRSRKVGAKRPVGVRNYAEAPDYPARLQQIGAALKAARESVRPKRTQWQSAHEVGISQPALSNYEQGLRNPPLTVFVDLCKLYETDGPTVLLAAEELWG